MTRKRRTFDVDGSLHEEGKEVYHDRRGDVPSPDSADMTRGGESLLPARVRPEDQPIDFMFMRYIREAGLFDENSSEGIGL